MEKVSFMSVGFDLTSPSRQVHPKSLVHLVKPPLNIKGFSPINYAFGVEKP